MTPPRLESPEVLHPVITSKLQLKVMRIRYPRASTTELCPGCGREITVPAYVRSRCPGCGTGITPCSMCMGCFSDQGCPFGDE